MRITKGTRGYGKKAAAMILALAIAATSVPAAAMASADTESVSNQVVSAKAVKSSSASTMSNSDFLRALPTKGIHVSVPMSNAVTEETTNSGKFEGYSVFIEDSFKCASPAVKNEIKAKTASLCKGKKTDYDKAEEIFFFVNEHMTYEYGAANTLDFIWRAGKGNCMSYALLTSVMLYYAGIPNGYAQAGDHVFNVALCDGRWIQIDALVAFDLPDEYYEKIRQIFIASDRMVFVVDDNKGIKLVQLGLDASKADKVIKRNGVTIPSWVKGYYYKTWRSTYPNLVLRGTRGTAAERLAKTLGLSKITYKGNGFTARKPIKLTVPRFRLKSGKRCFTIKYNKVKHAAGIQVFYQKFNSGKVRKKTYAFGKISAKKIRGLKKGSYFVWTRAYRKNGKKYVFGRCSEAYVVKVR